MRHRLARSALPALLFALALPLGACARQEDLSPPATTTTSSAGAAQRADAHGLVLSATACWLGGVWNDATGETTPPVRRCEATLRAAYGTVERGRVERLRALEPGEIRQLGSKIRVRANGEPGAHPDALGRLFDGIAAAMREEMLARRAADRVKMDTTGPRDRAERSTDERAGATELGAADALSALRALEVGELDAEARSVALLLATDRMRLAVDLPKHLKIVALGGVFRDVFGVSAPEMPSDAAAPLVAGTWLAYLTDVARAANRPLPTTLTDLRDREALAWADVLEGLADRLRAARDSFAERNDLEVAVDGVVRRLDVEYRETEASFLARGLDVR